MRLHKITYILAGIFLANSFGLDVRGDTISDGGFESPIVSPGTFQSFGSPQTIGSWTVLGGSINNPSVTVVSGTYSESGNGMTAFNDEEGIQSLDLTGPGNTGPTSGVMQAIATVTGQSYQISFWVGRAVTSNGSSFYQGDATIDLSINGGAGLAFTNPTTNGGTPGVVNWEKFTDDFVATGTSTTVAFFNGTAQGTNEAGLDNVSVNATPLPPAAWGGLALVGAFGLTSVVRPRAGQAN